MNGIAVLHKRPDEISQILVCIAYLQGGQASETQSRGLPSARADLLPPLPSLCEDGAGKMVSSLPASLSLRSSLWHALPLPSPQLFGPGTLPSLGFILAQLTFSLHLGSLGRERAFQLVPGCH